MRQSYQRDLTPNLALLRTLALNFTGVIDLDRAFNLACTPPLESLSCFNKLYFSLSIISRSRSLEQDTDDSIIASPAAKSKVSAFSFIISPPSRALNPPQVQCTSHIRGMMHPRGASCGKASTFGNFSWPTLLGCDSVFSKLAMIESNLDGKTLLKLAYGSKLFAKTNYVDHCAFHGLASYSEGQPYGLRINYIYDREVRAGYVSISPTKVYWFICFNSSSPGALLVCGVVTGEMVCEKIGECMELDKCSFESVSVVGVGDCK
ncbi:hypothetical protein Ahy_A04g017832 [Arachis hypogaea]|uniref:Uncharacterized protein n=1 Tax=Arachis hypogaea TaxID=3818 RepID=A0A445DC53_ARAHY|nr:hypothetical protein Ahy_A04g017832 [Arachis hypogaea]